MLPRTGLLIFTVIAAVLAGCASGIKRAGDVAEARPHFAQSGKQARVVTLRVTPVAQTKLSHHSVRFSPDALLAVMKEVLQARNLLAAVPDVSMPSIEIVVIDVHVRTWVSGALLPFMADNTDRVAGDVIVRDAEDRELQRFSVSAVYNFGGLVRDDARLDWLYETFARHAVDELTGVRKQ